MADITVNTATVTPANANTVKATGTSGGAITIGQAVYLDPSTGLINKAQANSANPTHAPNVVGIALDTVAGANQPITYATAGDVAFVTGLTTGTIYVVAADIAGGIAPSSDLVATNFVAVLGVALSVSILHLGIIPTAAQK